MIPEKLADVAQQKGEAAAEKKSAALAEMLESSLPERFSVDLQGDDIVVTLPRGGAELVAHPELRDVAFLMRGMK